MQQYRRIVPQMSSMEKTLTAVFIEEGNEK